MSGASGVAGTPNGETFRDGLQEELYLARLFVQQRFALGAATDNDEDDLHQLGSPRPMRYRSVTADKISIADYFDLNSCRFQHTIPPPNGAHGNMLAIAAVLLPGLGR